MVVCWWCVGGGPYNLMFDYKEAYVFYKYKVSLKYRYSHEGVDQGGD